MECPHTQTKAPSAARGSRNYGLDVLRALSMLFVVTLHLLGHGGVLDAAEGGAFASAYFLESLSICAVDCFVLISGYCLVSSSFKSRRIFSLWVEVFFYSIAIAIFAAVYTQQIPSGEQFFATVTPVFSSRWWFFTQYFALFWCTPLINLALSHMGKRSLRAAVIVIFLVFSLIPFVLHADVFKLSKGYSFAWFAMLYFIGGAIRLLQDEIRLPKIAGLALYVAGAAATAMGFILPELGIGESALAPYSGFLLSYTSPFVLVSALGIFWLCANLDIRNKTLQRAISWVTPSVFAIYLISDNPSIRTLFVTNAFAGYASLHPMLLPLAVLATALFIGVICVAIDKLRSALFKALKIEAGVRWLGAKLDNFLVGGQSSNG